VCQEIFGPLKPWPLTSNTPKNPALLFELFFFRFEQGRKYLVQNFLFVFVGGVQQKIVGQSLMSHMTLWPPTPSLYHIPKPPVNFAMGISAA